MFVKGNRHDSPLLREHIKNMKANKKLNALKYKKSKHFKQYFMADAGYDGKENLKTLIDNG